MWKTWKTQKRTGSWWKPVEVVEVVRKRVGDREGVGGGAGGLEEVVKRSRRSWESAEEAGKHGK